MSIRARIIISVAFEQIDCSPDSKTCTQSNDQRLKDTNSRIEKCHN